MVLLIIETFILQSHSYVCKIKTKMSVGIITWISRAFLPFPDGDRDWIFANCKF